MNTDDILKKKKFFSERLLSAKLKIKEELVKMPTRRQWARFFEILESREKILFALIAFLAIISAVAWWQASYRDSTVPVPDFGGTWNEGLIGEPRYLNPVLAQTNDVDRDLAQLLFANLMRYNSAGELVPDIVRTYDISEDGKTYTFTLKENLRWQDNQPLTSDDVIFTIELIQNPDYRSPLRFNWQGVKTERVDDLTFKFILGNKYAPFLNNAVVGVLPKHILGAVSSKNFPLHEFNLNPVGNGPYILQKLERDKKGNITSAHLARNNMYHLENSAGAKGPFIDKIIFHFFRNEEAVIASYNRKESNGINLIAASSLEKISRTKNINDLNLPRYFAVFFNTNQLKALTDKNVRLALNYATDKKRMVGEVLRGHGYEVNSPLLPGTLGYEESADAYPYSPEKAAAILEKAGWAFPPATDSAAPAAREKKINDDKEATKLEIQITTTEWPDLINAAGILKENWEIIGARVSINVASVADIQQDVIKPRRYETLLFGEILTYDPDPFSFWHSSQKKDPGLNLALYNNRNADKLLEEARQTLSQEERMKKYREFQKLLMEDVPAVFLYSPSHIYVTSPQLKGMEIKNAVTPAWRFADIQNWHLKTKRIKK